MKLMNQLVSSLGTSYKQSAMCTILDGLQNGLDSSEVDWIEV